jgi:hypothetical protein
VACDLDLGIEDADGRLARGERQRLSHEGVASSPAGQVRAHFRAPSVRKPRFLVSGDRWMVERAGDAAQAADREIDDFMTVPRSRPG